MARMNIYARELKRVERSLRENRDSLRDINRDINRFTLDLEDAQACLKVATRTYTKETLRVHIDDLKDELDGAKDDQKCCLLDIKDDEEEIIDLKRERDERSK